MQMSRNSLFNLCTLIVASISVNASAITSSELIDYYELSTKLLSHASYEVQSIIAIEGAQENIEPKKIERNSKIFRDGQRISDTCKDDIILNDGRKKSEIHTCILDKKAVVFDEGGKTGVFVDSNLAAWRQLAFAGLGGGVITEGYIFGDEDAKIFTILRESVLQTRSEMENIDGHQVYVLDGKSKRGKITVWLDPNANYHPRRIEIHKSNDDLLNGRPIASMTSEGNITKNRQLKEYTVIVDTVKIEKIGDVNLFTGANVTEVRIYVDGNKITATYPFQIKNINLAPDFLSTKAFDINLPDGTPVNDNDFPGGRFEVRQGKIVSVGTPFEEIDKTIDKFKQQQ